MQALDIDGAWLYAPKVFTDDRGSFLESFRAAEFKEVVGHPLRVAQVNLSVSRRGSLRGIHYAQVPPGQAKYVTCVTGAVLDVVVDIRTGSPTFARWHAVRLDDTEHVAVYVGEGLGHAFFALTDNATVSYLCSEPYRPDREHQINPLDPELGLPWPTDIEPLLSVKDAQAPTLDEAAQQGMLPSYDDCRSWYASLVRDMASGER